MATRQESEGASHPNAWINLCVLNVTRCNMAGTVDMGEVERLIKEAVTDGDKLRDLVESFAHNEVYVFMKPAERIGRMVRFEPTATSPAVEKTLRRIAHAYGLTEPVLAIEGYVREYLRTALGDECSEEVTRYMRQKPIVAYGAESYTSRRSGSTHRSA
jgi:hypothetical protein